MKLFLLVSLLLVSFTNGICSTDTTPPVIGSVYSSDVGYSSARISWTTNESTTSQIEYGTGADYGLITGRITPSGTNHTYELNGLSPDTTYYYRLRSKDSSGNETLSAANTFRTLIEEIFHVKYNWEFNGKTWTYSTDITESDYDFFHDKKRVNDYSEYVTNPNDDDWIKHLASIFVEEADKMGWPEHYYVPFALSFVQSLPYTDDDVTTGYDEYPRYPVETLVDGGGDCEDTSILFASIIREMGDWGYGAALLLLEEDSHMAAGVQITQNFLDSWDEEFECAWYPSPANGNMYAYCETTGENWEIGHKPEDLTGPVEILDVF